MSGINQKTKSRGELFDDNKQLRNVMLECRNDLKRLHDNIDKAIDDDTVQFQILNVIDSIEAAMKIWS